jgi:hypothetical protein
MKPCPETSHLNRGIIRYFLKNGNGRAEPPVKKLDDIKEGPLKFKEKIELAEEARRRVC